MSKNRNDKESMICLTPKLSQSFYYYSIQNKVCCFFLQKKSFLRKVGSGGLKKKGFLTALTTAIKKDPTNSLRKHANKLKVYQKTVRTGIKQDLSLDYAIWVVLENKINATSHSNIGSLKTAV